ncbi:MAG: TetR/AcrR family transcriptional regulator [Gammaproteobacteria bacterium]|jgi:AcrR family transcriptional regulator|nr:TetR/AcrR family transcriptional regulator [Gammaproteobacteria bacterium]
MTNQPKYQRRKEDRPQEIADAAFKMFAEKGYAATRIDDVAKRAGVSKGLTYLYYKTKEDLFKAVVKNVVIRRVDSLIGNVESTELSSEEFLRGPLLDFMKKVPGSPIAIVIRLLISEGPRHPDLVNYYYENVVARGLGAIRQFVARGVERGEFRREALDHQPHLFLAPMMLSMIWRLVFTDKPLDTDQLMESQIELLLAEMKA